MITRDPVRATLLAVTLLGIVGGCSERPRFQLGGECELTTECAAPLACRFGRCREECRDNRDCRLGLVCLRDDGLGACELDEIDRCTLSSDCEDESLVCLLGRCTNECVLDVDCPPGAVCMDGGCHDPTETGCEYTSDCVVPFICTPNGVCSEQCRGDRDCRDGTVCDASSFPAVCVPPFDGGMPEDAGEIDASMADASMSDASMLDATTPIDGGTTMPAPEPLLSAGYQHTCAVRAMELRCWGSNDLGQIGIGTTVDAPTSTVVSVSAPTLLATGAGHTCALGAAGLRCWGDNTSGQIGDGTATTPRTSPVAVAVTAPVWLAAGRDHTCAVLASGGVSCWGDNAAGQLGDGTTTQRRSPTPVTGLLASAVEVTARARHTCARLVDGRIQCWGENRYGQLGDGASTTAPGPMPRVVMGVTDAVEVLAGSTHTCARRLDGTVLCWGNNAFGQLGDGTRTAHVVAAIVPGLPPIAELAAGVDHVCGRAVDGRVFCWGGNLFGQAGQDPSMPSSREVLSPREVTSVPGAAEISAGDLHTCARVGTGLRCWGWNSRGQLGDGTMTESWMPVTVSWP